QSRALPAEPVLHRSHGDRLRRGEARGPRQVRPPLPRDAGRGRPAPAERLRGVVPVGGPRRRRGGPDRGSRGSRYFAMGMNSRTAPIRTMTPKMMNWTLPEATRLVPGTLRAPSRYAGPRNSGGFPPVSTALRLRSARSRNGTWTTNRMIEAPRNA